jgi:sporulation protein YlmC with PRC-barrel domain
MCSSEQTQRQRPGQSAGERVVPTAHPSATLEGETAMLRSMNDLEGYAIGATDGTVGQVKDFYFDDEAWVVRYLVVETGAWLNSRRVLISPFSIGTPNWSDKLLPVTITKEQVKHSPDIDTEKPVSRQHEIEYLGYYGYPYYWGGSALWGGELYPNMMIPGAVGLDAPYESRADPQAYERAEAVRHRDDDPHLRSCKAVAGYHIVASDGEIGHVHGLLVDERTWAIRYLVVNTSNWWVGHQVLIAPQWITGVSWSDATVTVDLTREAVREAPPYDQQSKLDRNQEIGIYKHYGRPGYWGEELGG